VLLRLSDPYIPDTFEGEAVVSIGKCVDLAHQGASGIINAIPFGCMPGTIVAGVMQVVKKEYDMPFITIPYDGTASSTNEMLLEAFMDQAGVKARRKNGSTKKNNPVAHGVIASASTNGVCPDETRVR
jgi:predicted nucleotide-binding protein (sugar kinase/HSP70/actin superfamily)